MKIQTFDSAFNAILEPEEAKIMRYRSDMMSQIIQNIKKNNWSKDEAIEKLKTNKQTINFLMTGDISNLPNDLLEKLVATLG
ncbi:XRE family transcriptional regulator [Kaistella sp.]|uniref:XRE family transcriptional regulator n=1 Tax=Kaistella sp. TaxID=2782235 RepID=UPI0035A0665F